MWIFILYNAKMIQRTLQNPYFFRLRRAVLLCVFALTVCPLSGSPLTVCPLPGSSQPTGCPLDHRVSPLTVCPLKIAKPPCVPCVPFEGTHGSRIPLLINQYQPENRISTKCVKTRDTAGKWNFNSRLLNRNTCTMQYSVLRSLVDRSS